MCLACYTQDEIAAAVGLTHQAVDAVLQKTADLPEIAKPAANHLTDVSPHARSSPENTPYLAREPGQMTICRDIGVWIG
jgi:hypothetical protein